MITEEKFVELMERIPVMEEKLNELLLTLNKIAESGNLMGIKQSDDFPHFTYDDQKAADDAELLRVSNEKIAAAKILNDEANGIREQLGI